MTIGEEVDKVRGAFHSGEVIGPIVQQHKVVPTARHEHLVHGSEDGSVVVTQAIDANLKATAFRWAATAFKAEYRDKIKDSIKKNMERTARTPVKEEPAEPETPCPYCSRPFAEFSLSCPHCSMSAPFCIATGKHLSRGDISKCPQCNYCGFTEPLVKLLQQEPLCPMCDTALRVEDIVSVPPPQQASYLKSISLGNIDEPKKNNDPL